ncbi:MAG: transcription elongation factor GreA [Candidatus Hydrogenedentes bacterium]|nr:transcription elongation factor GreA [Candidatus Hydrogenedentota bacterium]HOJ68240.1 transcription elongation factor GreA [Candidatus Hydrogenedentota bacterium]
MSRVYLSAEGLKKLHERLDALRKRMTEVVAEIEHARGLGDLRENAEYHAAKEEQALLHARIRDLEDQIARAEVLDPNRVDMSKAYVGATVRVRNVTTGDEDTWTLVSPVEADIQNNRLSVQSPVGSALLGKGVGDIAVARVPAGEIQFEVLEITYGV